MVADPISPTPTEPPGSASEPRTSRLERLWIYALFFSALLLIALLSIPYLPTHDGPQHLYLAHLGKHYGDPETIYATLYRPTVALTALGFSLVYGPLADLMPWRPAFAATLAVILLLWCWGYMALAHAVRKERLVIGFLGFASAFQWALYMGLFSYLLSLAVGFFTAAVALRHRDWQLRHRLWIAGLLTSQAVFHAFGAQVTALLLLVLVLVRSEKKRWLKELATLALMGLPVALLSAYAAGWLGGGVRLPASSPADEVSTVERLWLLRGLFVGGPAWRGWPLLLLAVVGLGFLARRWRARVASPEEVALGLTSATLLAMGTLSPLHLAQWEYFSPRFLPPAVLFALPLLPVEALRNGWPRALSRIAVLVFVSASVIWAGWFNRSLYQRCSDAFAGLSQPIRRTGFRLPVTLDSTCGHRVALLEEPYPFFEPAVNLGALYAVAQGGAVPYTFALVPQLHPFVLRTEALKALPPVPPRSLYWWVYDNPATRYPPERRREFTTQIAMEASAFEDVVFFGDTEQRQVLLDRGYAVDFSSGRLAILRFVGCPVTLSVRDTAVPPGPVYAETSWYPLEQPLGRQMLSPDAFAPTGVASVPIARAPCGPVRLRVFADVDQSGAFSEGDRRCKGADEHGYLSRVLTHSTTALRCDLELPRP